MKPCTDDNPMTACCARRQWGDGEHDANCPGLAYETQRASDPDPRDDDDWTDAQRAALEDGLDDVLCDKVDAAQDGAL